MTYLVDINNITRKTFKGEKDDSGDWTYDTKITVCELLQNLGNARATSELTEVPMMTIRHWQKQDWWPEILHEVQKQKRLELNSRLNKIVDTALSKIEDRLENGDYFFNQKTGTIERKQVSLRDANQVAKDILGQQISLQKIDNGQADFQTSAKDLLTNLANEFAKLNKKLKQGNAEDIKFVEKLV